MLKEQNGFPTIITIAAKAMPEYESREKYEHKLIHSALLTESVQHVRIEIAKQIAI